jgi:hypothetical protein
MLSYTFLSAWEIQPGIHSKESSNHRKVEYVKRDSLQNVNTAPTLGWV